MGPSSCAQELCPMLQPIIRRGLLNADRFMIWLKSELVPKSALAPTLFVRTFVSLFLVLQPIIKRGMLNADGFMIWLKSELVPKSALAPTLCFRTFVYLFL